MKHPLTIGEALKMEGWLRVKDGAEYAGVSERTFRGWLKNGLKHSKLPSGTILIKPSSIDEYLEQFEVTEGVDLGRIADEILEGIM